MPESGVELVPEDTFILEAGFERLHGGLGVMADDAMAAVYANVSLRILLWLLPGWVA